MFPIVQSTKCVVKYEGMKMGHQCLLNMSLIKY